MGGEKRSGTRKGTGLWTFCDRDIRGFLEDNCVSTGGLPMPLWTGPPYTYTQAKFKATDDYRELASAGGVITKRVAGVSSDARSRSSKPGSKSSSVTSTASICTSVHLLVECSRCAVRMVNSSLGTRLGFYLGRQTGKSVFLD